ncbi:hypothetical protein HOS18_gp30 [Aeromonas phage CF7]|uniref:Uncharacterized protein n=1 Tax=Aeromonas phage CF7 TaxID=2507411 RepID=A0A249XLL0_9CAUD|nr:hypothetical protein HOS18_gp30 [Aeromonas phage CF7]ASZ71976.1 hypothetical protein CF7_30 [Aeromonas phage CF7]
MPYILLLTDRELRLIRGVRGELLRLAQGGEPIDPVKGICWNMSRYLGCEHSAANKPAEYKEWTRAQFKLLYTPDLTMYGPEAYLDEGTIKKNGRITLVDFTALCAVTFTGFELTGDGYYPIPDARGADGGLSMGLWEGYNGARRRIFCQHMVDVIDQRLAQRDALVVKLLRPASVISPRDKDLLWAFNGAFQFLPQARPLPERAATSGLCFRVTSMVENMLYNTSLLCPPHSSNTAGPLHSVAVRLLVERLQREPGHWQDQLMLALERITSRHSGSVPSFVGAVALCCHPEWFAEVPANDRAMHDALDYPIPGGKEAYTSPCTDNWQGEGLELRLALAESCAKQLRRYLNGEF